MTGSLRSTARNPVAIALMGLLILVFLLLGVGGGSRFPDAFLAGHADAVVIAGGHSTSSNDFRRIFEQQKERFEQQSQQAVPVEVLVENGFDQQLLSELAKDQAEGEMLTRAGVVPAPALIDSEIKKLPFAFDKVTGKFSEAQFTQLLASEGLTPRQAQAELSDEVAQRHFALAVEAGFQVPRLYAALTAVAALENRDITYFVLGPNVVPQPAPPTDSQLMAFMKENAAQLTLPERRIVTLVRFSAAALAPSVQIDPKAVQQQFDSEKGALSTPETRTVIQIPVKTAQEGAEAARRLATGEDPAAIARAFGEELVTYQDKPQSAIADGKIAQAAFSMKPGAVAGPVAGELGLAALKVSKVTPGRPATFEEAKAKIEADLRQRAAEDKSYDLSQKFDDAREAGAGVAAAAQKVGVAAITLGPVTARGLGPDGKPNPLLDEKTLKTAFAAAQGEETDLQDAGKGEYYALKVEKVLPPSLPPIDSNRPILTQAYLRTQYLKALSAKAQGLIDQIKGGLSMDKAAAEAGAHLVHQAGMERILAQQYQNLGRDFLAGVFGSKPGEVFGAMTPGGVAIGRLQAVRPGDETSMAKVVQAVRGRMTQDYMRDLVGEVRDASEKSVHVATNLKLARQTIGVDSSMLAKARGKAGGNAK
ncbi:MAG: peptidylprolyl isomerase [Caulobacteraceae bacterium]